VGQVNWAGAIKVSETVTVGCTRIPPARTRSARPQARISSATRLLAAAEALRRGHGMPMPPADRGQHQRRVAKLRTELAGEFAAAWTDGAAMTWERAQRAAESLTTSGMAIS